METPDTTMRVIVAGPASHSAALLREIEALAQRLGALLGCPGRAAWFDQGRPALADLLGEVVAEGATRLVVVPYLLQWRYPDQYSLPARLRLFNAAHPEVAIHLAAPLGLVPEAEALLRERAVAALAAPTIGERGAAGLEDFARQRPLPKRPPTMPPLPAFAHHVLLCQGRTCLAAGATELEQALRDEAKARDLPTGAASIRFTRTRCLGPCAGAAVVACYPGGDWYGGLAPDQAAALIETLVGAGQALDEQRLARAE